MKKLGLPLILIACTGCWRADSGTDDSSCYDRHTVVGVDEETELDFTGRDILALVGDPFGSSFYWNRGRDVSRMELTISYEDGEVRHYDCFSDRRLELAVSAEFSVDDGSFDEMIVGILSSDVSGQEAVVEAFPDPHGLSGDLELGDFVEEADYVDGLTMRFRASFRSSWSEGTVSVSGYDGETHVTTPVGCWNTATESEGC